MKTFIKAFVVIVSACLAMVWIEKQPALFPVFNLINDDRLATSLNGLTSPVIGISGAILLYLALTKQTEALRKQTESNELSRQGNSESVERHNVDLIYSLFTQVESQIGAFFFSYSEGSGKDAKECTFYGNEGLFRATASYYQSNTGIVSNEPFSSFPWSHRFMLVVRSMEQLGNSIDDLAMPISHKTLFANKWIAYYQCYLRNRMEVLCDAWSKQNTPNDTYQWEVRLLNEKWTQYKVLTGIDILRHDEETQST